MTSNSTRDVLKELDALREAATAGPYAGTRGLQVLTVDGLVIAPSVYAGVKPDKPYKPDDLARCRVNAQLLALAPVLAKEAVAIAEALQRIVQLYEDDRKSNYAPHEHQEWGRRVGYGDAAQIAGPALDSFLASLDEQLGEAK